MSNKVCKLSYPMLLKKLQVTTAEYFDQQMVAGNPIQIHNIYLLKTILKPTAQWV